MDTYIDRFEKLEYGNEAYARIATLLVISEAFVTEVRTWLLEGTELWQTALGGSEDVLKLLRDNKVAIDEAREKGKQVMDVMHAALTAHAKATKSKAELLTVFPDGTVGGIGKGDLAVLSCLAQPDDLDERCPGHLSSPRRPGRKVDPLRNLLSRIRPQIRKQRHLACETSV